jgi:proton-dependent oligopeptide transporter, POT family
MALTDKFHIALSIDPLLVWNYGSMGVICGVSGILFWLSVRNLDKQEDALNNLKRGEFGEKN